MKKQQKTYLLLAAVIGIWGAIAFQFFKTLNPEDSQQKIAVREKFVPKKTATVHFHTVKKLERDPFLGKIKVAKKAVQKKEKVEPKKVVRFPKIVYNGIVKGNGNQSYIITINGQQQVFRIKEILKGVQLIKANHKEAVVKFEGTLKTFVLD